MLELDRIRIDGGTQSRAELNQAVVDEYAEAYRAGEQFPPVVVFFDGSDRWLADGFHRYFGAKKAGLAKIYEEIIPGTQRDAVLYSLSANASHGLRRSDADKRRAIMRMLEDPEWGQWSDREIARRCAVHPTTVARVKADIASFYRGEQEQGGVKFKPGRAAVFHAGNLLKISPTVYVDSEKSTERTYTTKHGTQATMNTANIGRTPAPAPADAGATPTAPPASDAHGTALDMADSRGIDSAPTPPAPAARAPSPAARPPVQPEAPAEHQQRVAGLEEEIAALREQLQELQADNASIAQVLDASDQLSAAMDEAKRERDLARGLQARINSLMTQVAELKRQVAHWKKKAGG